MLKELCHYNISHAILYLIMGIMLSRIGTSMTIPFLTLFLYKHIGLSYFSTGLIISMSFMAQMFGGFLGGMLSDIFGKYKLMSAALLMYATTFILFGVCAQYIHTLSLLTFLFATINLLCGFSRSWTETLAQALISDMALSYQKRLVFGLRYTAANLGFGIGVVLGLLLGITGSLYSFYYTSFILYIYFIFFIIIIFNKSKNIPGTTQSLDLKIAIKCLIFDKSLRYIIVAGALIYIGYVQQEALFVSLIIATTGSTAFATGIISLNTLLSILLPIPLSIILKKLSPCKIIKWGVVMLVVGLCIIGFANNHLWQYILGEIFFTLGEVTIFPYFAVIIGQLAPIHLHGAYFGAINLQFFGRALGPVLSGFLLYYINISYALLIISIISISSIFFLNKVVCVAPCN